MTDEHLKLTLVSSNPAPKKARRVRNAPKVSPYCPVCNGSVWFYVNKGRADYSAKLAVKERCCVHCMAGGKVTTW